LQTRTSLGHTPEQFDEEVTMTTQEAVVMTDEDLATHLSKASDEATAVRVAALISDAGGTLEPMFPGSTGEMRTYFHGFVEPSEFDRVAERLRDLPGVIAAYLKPPDAAP
jgi:hypothetical protein